MTYFRLILALLVCTLAVHAAPTKAAPVPTAEPTPGAPHQQTTSAWPKEAIFTLIGILLAAVTIIVMILVAWPALRDYYHSLQVDIELATLEGKAWDEYMESKKKTLQLRRKWEESLKVRST